MKRLIIIASLILVGCDPYAAREMATGESTFSTDEIQSMARNICKDGYPAPEKVAVVRRAANVRVDYDEWRMLQIDPKDSFYATKFGMCEEWVLDPAYKPFLDAKSKYEAKYDMFYAFDMVQIQGKKTMFKKEYQVTGTIVNRRDYDVQIPVIEVTFDIASFYYGEYKGHRSVQSFYVDLSEYGHIPPDGLVPFKFKHKTVKGVNDYSLAWCMYGNHADPFNNFRYIESEDLTCTQREKARDPVGDERKGYPK